MLKRREPPQMKTQNQQTNSPQVFGQLIKCTRQYAKYPMERNSWNAKKRTKVSAAIQFWSVRIWCSSLAIQRGLGITSGSSLKSSRATSQGQLLYPTIKGQTKIGQISTRSRSSTSNLTACQNKIQYSPGEEKRNHNNYKISPTIFSIQ